MTELEVFELVIWYRGCHAGRDRAGDQTVFHGIGTERQFERGLGVYQQSRIHTTRILFIFYPQTNLQVAFQIYCRDDLRLLSSALLTDHSVDYHVS